MSSDITTLLQTHFEGEREAFDRLMPLVYDRLCVIARRQIGRMRSETMDTSALVRETYMQLVDESGIAWRDRGHFYAICARTMRRILVDAMRRRMAAKRGGGVASSTIDVESIGGDSQMELVLAVDQALDQLSQFNEHLARLVECRFFAGMSEEETALALNTSLRSVQRDWVRARAWLQKALA